MESIHISLVVMIALLSLVFAIRVLGTQSNRTIKWAFFLFSLSTALWIVVDFTVYQHSLSVYQTFLNRLDIAVISLMIVALAYFVTVFPRIIIKIPKFVYWLSVSATIAMLYIILFSKAIVYDAYMEAYGSNIHQGNLFLLFASFATFFALYAIVILIIKFLKFKDEEKKQIKFIFYGIACITFFNLLFNLFIPIFTKSFEYGRFGSYSSIIFVGFTAYAILKTHLFNLRVILTETAVIIINVVSVIQIFTANSVMEGLLLALFSVIIFYGSYLLLISVRREIRQREQLQKLSDQLAQANLHLQELDQMKTEFVSLASHELLTPVSAIEGYLSMILDEHLAKVDDPKAAKYLDRIYSSSRRLARLIADMLNISRIEEGRLLVEKKEVNLSEVIKQVIEEVKFKAQDGRQEIVFQDNHWQTFGDPDKIKEILVNLIGNSIKYSKNPGTITIEVSRISREQVETTWNKIEEEIRCRPLDDQEAIKSAVDPHYRALVDGDQLRIAVHDEGIGIPREELPRLFKKFHRVGDYTTAESQGTGLGLYISRALVELHHGRIWAESEGHGKGSTFTFTLPDFAARDEILAEEAKAEQSKEQLKPLARPMSKSAEF